MPVDVSRFRLGGPAAVFHHNRNLKRDSCSTGGFYKSPTAGQSLDSSSPINIAWDTSCLPNAKDVDIYLYAPGAQQPLLHTWRSVFYSKGSYSDTLQPKWWNSTDKINLQLTIVEAGSPSFMSPFPAGPVFTATNSASSGSSGLAGDASSNTNNAGGVTVVNNEPATHHGPSKGVIAAAVIVPILFIALLVGLAYLKIARDHGKEKRKRFSQMVDKRMSTISSDWKSITPAGANAAIRQSMHRPSADGGVRASTFSFNAPRPSTSSYTVDGGQAGIGAGFVAPDEKPPMSQLRPGVRAANLAERKSKVSFADTVRPSLEARRTVTSRAFHSGWVPAVDEHEESESSSQSGEADGVMSPTQTKGPFSLSAEDIQARLQSNEAIRSPNTPDSAMLSPKSSVPFLPEPAPTHTSPTSPAFMSMQPLPAVMMSPDDMLRAYAERRVASPPIVGGRNVPSPPAPSYGSNMRTLYAPAGGAAPNMMSAVQGQEPKDNRMSMATSHYAEEDAYGGTA
ncbi:hypothetical protein DENSPDRAFT_859800 [Dentipellis sp. KUC8613]|nr:hypothetical protein DENSPDRAFT_859800 [Dentipellis sp. KUC8613]